MVGCDPVGERLYSLYCEPLGTYQQFLSVIKTSQLMLYREIIDVCSQIHTKHINTLCGQNVELLNVKLGGTYCDHWALEG